MFRKLLSLLFPPPCKNCGLRPRPWEKHGLVTKTDHSELTECEMSISRIKRIG